jgi:hypothetical protein
MKPPPASNRQALPGRSRFLAGTVFSLFVLLAARAGLAANWVVTPAGAQSFQAAAEAVADETPGVTLVSTRVDQGDATFTFSFGTTPASTFDIHVTRDGRGLLIAPRTDVPEGVDGTRLEAKLRARVPLASWQAPGRDSSGDQGPTATRPRANERGNLVLLGAPLLLVALAVMGRRALRRQLGETATSIACALGFVSLCAMGWWVRGTHSLRVTAIVCLAVSLGWFLGGLRARSAEAAPADAK